MLWSASNAMKHRISRDYVGTHRVWCSEAFEGAMVGAYAPGGMPAASSDPASLYRKLLHDVRTSDRHSNEINRQKKGLQQLALSLRGSGRISPEQAAEITVLLRRAQIIDWRPLIYAIPYAAVSSRVERVDPKDWAGLEPEFIIPDLREDEFVIIEPVQCR